MAMGRSRKRQQSLWVPTQILAKAPGHPFYERLSKLLAKHEFAEFAEKLCRPFYAETQGRPSIAPTVYFQTLLIGYFEGLESERRIAWRIADSFSLRTFLGLELADPTPNHSTISRTRRLLGIDIHEAFFGWVLQILAKEGLLKGKTLGVDGTTLEADAAMRSIVRRDTGEGYKEFLKGLAKESGIEEPTDEELARFDRKRPKKMSNKEWRHPHDPDARIAKMKRGNTRMAHKAEHAVDMETGAIVAVTIQPADRGDTKSLEETMTEVGEVLLDVLDDEEAADSLGNELARELVTDKGYHSNEVLTKQSERGIRTYFAEPERGLRNWKGKKEEQAAVYANRRRIRGERGSGLQKKRGELVERSFAHCYESGAMRRVFLHGHENIRKRILIHVAGFNLGLVLRKLCGFGTPRGLWDHFSSINPHYSAFFEFLESLCRPQTDLLRNRTSVVSFSILKWPCLHAA